MDYDQWLNLPSKKGHFILGIVALLNQVRVTKI